jgi:hypothetical protein
MLISIFSNRIQKRLNGMSGEELFKLKKGDLEKYCGKEEGHRLDSQLTLQRRASGVLAVSFSIKISFFHFHQFSQTVSLQW